MQPGAHGVAAWGAWGCSLGGGVAACGRMGLQRGGRRALPTECHVSVVYLGERQRSGGCGESDASDAEWGCAMRLTTRPVL